MEKRGFVIDTMNYCKDILDLNDHLNLEKPNKVIGFFKKFDVGDLIFVVDGGKRSSEEIEVFKKRKAQGFSTLQSFPIPISSTLIFYLLKEAGFQVCFSSSHDCDETIARIANDNGYDVVSKDSDFFYYVGRQYVVYKSIMDLNTGKIFLWKNPHKKNLEKRKPLEIPKEVDVDWERSWVHNNINVEKTLICGYGGKSIFTGKNVFSCFKCLRRVVYFKNKLESGVLEMIPQYVKQSRGIRWEEELVEPREAIGDTSAIMRAAKRLTKDKQSQAGFASILADLVEEITGKQKYLETFREGIESIKAGKFLAFVEDKLEYLKSYA